MFESQSISEREPGNIERLKQFTSTTCPTFEQLLCGLCKDMIMHIIFFFIGGRGAFCSGS